MTKEEAKSFLDSILPTLSAKMQLAIKTLSAEPCEDAISRQAVINGVDNYIEKAQSTSVIDDFISFEELVVKALPPVTPKQKMGYWIKVDDEEPIAYDCSQCGAMVSRRYRFCPMCGEKMVESEENE